MHDQDCNISGILVSHIVPVHVSSNRLNRQQLEQIFLSAIVLLRRHLFLFLTVHQPL